MRTITKTLYKYDELSDTAKEKARDWYRSLAFSDSSDWEFIYSEAESMGAIMGIDIDQRTFKTVGGGTGSEPRIYFSGFSSQGDGACFEGSYHYRKGALAKIRAEAPNDTELQRIAKGLQDVQRRHFYRLEATCTHRGHYYHSGCMSVEVRHEEDHYRLIGAAEDVVTDLLRDFADWIYKQLEAEHDCRTSDEQVIEAIEANEYEFYENGSRA